MKRNILIIFAIMLTTLLIAVVIAVGTSYWEAVSQRQIRMEGMDYDIALTEPRDDQVKEIRSMENVRYAGVAVKCAIVEKYEDRTLDKTKLYWLDETCWEKQTVPALEKIRRPVSAGRKRDNDEHCRIESHGDREASYRHGAADGLLHAGGGKRGSAFARKFHPLGMVYRLQRQHERICVAGFFRNHRARRRRILPRFAENNIGKSAVIRGRYHTDAE